MSPLTASELAPGLMLGERVQIGERVSLGAHVVLHDNVVVGDGCTIQDGAVLGKLPVLGTYSTASRTVAGPVLLEPGAKVGCHAVIGRGVRIGARTVIGDFAFLREYVQIAEDSMIGLGVSVGPGVRIGARCKFQTHCVIAKGTVVEEDVRFGPAVYVLDDVTIDRHGPEQPARGATIRRASRIGANAVVMAWVEVGAEALVGAACVVTRDVPPRTVVVGSPARTLREVRDEELSERWLRPS